MKYCLITLFLFSWLQQQPGLVASTKVQRLAESNSQQVQEQANRDTAEVLFETSFENIATGAFESLFVKGSSLAGIEFEAKGTVSINAKFARTGQQCLHMLGDDGNTLTMLLPKSLQSARGIRFHAERWTSRKPFAFAIDLRRKGQEWKELANLNTTRVGARFLTKVQLAFPASQPVTAIRFRALAAPQSGLLIDDLALLKTEPTEQLPRPVQIPSEKLELIDSRPLFVSGTNDTHTYRIPAIITAANGDLIAACDARRKNSADLIHQRSIDIVLRRSTDDGKTWTPIEELDSIDDGGCSDPSLLLDKETGLPAGHGNGG